MLLFDKITEILSKGYNALDNQDKRTLIQIQDELYQAKAQQSEIILAKTQEIKKVEAVRTLELKEEKEEVADAKLITKLVKKYTEAQIDSIIFQENEARTTELNTAKTTKEMLEGKIEAMNLYITAIRDKLKPTNAREESSYYSTSSIMQEL